MRILKYFIHTFENLNYTFSIALIDPCLGVLCDLCGRNNKKYDIK